jgi:hypothetical protein
MSKNNLKTTKKEIIVSALAITIFISGIVLSSLALIGEYILPRNNNWVLEGETAVAEFLSISLSWLTWGSIFLVLGAILFTINMSVFANAEQIQREKVARRAQRLQDTLES